MGTRSIDFLRLLSTNQVPTAADSASLRQEADVVVTQIRAFETSLRQYQTILHPLRRVPPEVLGEIFKIMVEEGAGDADNDQIMALCLVCRGWRDAAYLTHTLWGTLEVKLSPALSYDQVKRWLNRSPQNLRSLTVVETGADECVEESYTNHRESRSHVLNNCPWRNKALAELLTKGPSLYSLHLDMSSSHCLQTALTTALASRAQSQPFALESIESLSLMWRGDSLWEASLEGSQSFYDHLPKLSTLHLSLPREEHMMRGQPVFESFPPWLSIHIPPVVLGNLTSLSFICNWDVPEVMLALKECMSLVDLCLDFEGAPTCWSECLENPVVDLPKLRTLKALNMCSTHAPLYMPCLRLPGVIHLQISFCVYDTDDEDVENTGLSVLRFVDSISLSQECLQSLAVSRDIQIERIKAFDLSRMLVAFPSLNRLSFNYLTFEPSELSEEPTCSRTVLLPFLEHLELLNVPGEFDLGAMLDFLVSCRRLGGVASLETLYIGYAKPSYMRSEYHDIEIIDEDVPIAESLASLGIRLQGHISTGDQEIRFGLEQ